MRRKDVFKEYPKCPEGLDEFGDELIDFFYNIEDFLDEIGDKVDDAKAELEDIDHVNELWRVKSCLDKLESISKDLF